MSTPVRAAVIGLGWPGREHAKSYSTLDSAEVVAACDLDSQTCERACEELGIAERYSDYKDMLKRDDVDVVSVCLPNFLHAPVTIDCLKAGKHVLCEKPPALNAAEAKKMAKAADANGRILQYAMVLRFGAAAQYVRSLVDKGELGDVYYGRATYLRRRGIPVGKGGWFVDKARAGGGALIDIGVHALDRAWYLMGNPNPVAVFGSAYLKFRAQVPKEINFDVDDGAFALVKFENGATLMLETTWAYNLPNESAVQISGDRGGARLDPLTIYTEQDGTVVDIAPTIPDNQPFVAQVAHFVECARTGQTPIAFAAQGTQLMQMLDGIYKSSETGRMVAIR